MVQMNRQECRSQRQYNQNSCDQRQYNESSYNQITCPTRNCNIEPNCPNNKQDGEWALAMAYVPWQKWQQVMDGRDGLAHGTIFKELVLPFYCASVTCNGCRRGGCC